MKRFTLLFSLLVYAITIAGCGDDPASSANQTPNGSMYAKVDGSAWSPTNLTPSNAAGNLVMVGSEISGASTRQVNITVTGAKQGAFNLGGINGAIGVTLNYTEGSLGSVKVFSATGGKITINEFTSTGAKGTFTADVEEQGSGATHAIAEGTFDVKF